MPRKGEVPKRQVVVEALAPSLEASLAAAGEVFAPWRAAMRTAAAATEAAATVPMYVCAPATSDVVVAVAAPSTTPATSATGCPTTLPAATGWDRGALLPPCR